ncbi:sugar phosphate isomerase/epimerase family protein [Catalinimonas niigatensis]|uniref:sugar phosphate isomerase/epimerase family protein n=1 Tax=Catalinimonas niigatensis TaxID=1397264 RepID=UPI002666B025|nr:TIM barrel protein [Catalinimonas niigatensis]WPP49219.1 TIM barrel protein [Catalinimonas niigatensis]
MNRRTFLAQSGAFGSSLMLNNLPLAKEHPLPFTVPSDFSLKIMATNWGFEGSWEAFCAKAKDSGYDGIEVWVPQQDEDLDQLMNAVDKHDLSYGFLASGSDADFNKHLAQFQQSLDKALSLKPLFINCHSGRDYFTFAQNKQIVDYTTQKNRSSGINIYHETHRSRMLFAAHITRQFIENIPELRLTLDISHWCNVHESLLQDQEETVKLALSRTGHVHARVGHAESPQVTDPRAPEWKQEVETHFAWWDQVVKQSIAQGQALTMTAEFGPPNYMAMVPFTRQPLADLWDVNAYMMQLWRERYSS